MSRTFHFSCAIAAALASAALLLGGCASPPSSAPSPQSPIAGKPSNSGPSEWLAQAWQGWQRAQANPSRPLAPTPRLALRAPAPLEPPLLERLQLAPQISGARVKFDEAGLGAFSFAPALSLAPASYGNEVFASGQIWERALSQARFAGARSFEPAPAGVAGNWSALQEAMERRQVSALQNLVLRVSRQRREASADEEGLLRADLAEDLDRVERLGLDSLAPNLGPPERLKRLSELRLKLISNLAIAPSAVRQADAEREKIEIEIRALLRQQEIERAGLLQKLRREVPARLQAQREGQITSVLQQVRQADADLIQLLLADQGRRVRLDFDAPARFFLPAPIAGNTSGNTVTPSEVSFNKNQFRTSVASASSLAPIAPPALALAEAQVLVPSSVKPLASGEAGAARRNASGQDEAQRRWRELLARRAKAWQAPVR